jgi:pimeloyl-ACP methyl ester carboxylesterase
MADVEPFEIHVDDAVLDDLRTRLARARFPDEIDGVGWEYGVPARYLRDLVSHWHDVFDWRAQEARLNELPQFRAPVDGHDIHFVHVRSGDDAFPLLLLHGWPGSFTEFLDVVPRLAGEFDLVVPSLPGYGFSDAPRSPGWGTERIAAAFAALMHHLGYDRYGVQGGDWGAQIATRLAVEDGEHCAGAHLNMPVAGRPAEPVRLTGADEADLAALAYFQREESGYAVAQQTKPQTLGAALHDSPSGLLAWIVEKFRTWSDCAGNPETVFTRDQLLTNVTLYWVTGTITSSARLYREHRLADGEQQYVQVPTGVARFPKEPIRYPRAWVERAYNVTHWSDMPRGGHFAAMEQPSLLADDVTDFFRTVR